MTPVFPPIVVGASHPPEEVPGTVRRGRRCPLSKSRPTLEHPAGTDRGRPEFRRTWILLAVAIALAGCATRPGPETLDPVVGRTAGAKAITVFAVTDRSPAGTTPAFGAGRGALTYEQFTMEAVGSAAAGRAGASALSREGDPSKDFMTVGRQELDRKTFEASVNRMRKAESDDVVVFVHSQLQLSGSGVPACAAEGRGGRSGCARPILLALAGRLQRLRRRSGFGDLRS